VGGGEEVGGLFPFYKSGGKGKEEGGRRLAVPTPPPHMLMGQGRREGGGMGGFVIFLHTRREGKGGEKTSFSRYHGRIDGSRLFQGFFGERGGRNSAATRKSGRKGGEEKKG